MMVWKEIQKMVDRPMVICCVVCNSILSFTKDVFTVGGAEGSTSTYVNGGGYIHQITTLRTLVDENKVVFEGFPSTENRYVKRDSKSSIDALTFVTHFPI
jgi:hypothetical protein